MLRVSCLALCTASVAAMSTMTRSPFATKALAIVSAHKIVRDNPYCVWFARGEATVDEARDLVQQFSVFSNLFLLAQRTSSESRA